MRRESHVQFCERPGVQLLRPTLPVTWNGMGIPLLWMLLPTAGNSSTPERTELLDRLRKAFPDMRIAALMGDREFIGDAWMAYLQREKIPFVLRLRENQHVLRAGYVALPISVIAQHLKVGGKMIVKGNCQLGRANETLSASVRLVITRLASDELLALACSGSARHALARYRQRWTIGVSSQRARCHVGESPTEAKRLRLRSKGGAVARKQDGGALRQHARKECARSIRLQRTVNADVASLHVLYPVAETVDNARRQQGPTKRSPKRRSSPAGYQRRHDANDSVSTGETLDARRAKSCRGDTSYNREWEMEGEASGRGTGSEVAVGRS